MKKRLFSLLLTLCMVLSLLPFPAAAADIVESGTCGENLTWTVDSDGVLTVSGTGEMENYGNEDYGFFEGENSPLARYGVERVVINDGVTSIGSCAFIECSMLKEVEIPDSVTSIGDGAFYKCNCLEDITIPGSVEDIGEEAFSCSIYLKHVTLLDGVKHIGKSAFYHCTALTDISIPTSVSNIGAGAFMYCLALTDVSIPEGVQTIERNTFHSCGALEHIAMPGSVKSIGREAFQDCDALKEITFHGTQEEWDAIAVEGYNDCLKAAEVHFVQHLFGPWTQTKAPTTTEEGEETRTCSVCGETETRLIDRLTPPGMWASGECGKYDHNVIWTLSHSGVLTISGTGEMRDYRGTSDDRSPFYENRYIKSVVIEPGVTSIGENVFYLCQKMETVSIPDTVTSIGSGAFYSCCCLTDVVIPDSVTSIGYSAFYACVRLERVTLSKNLKELNGFSECDSLTSITIPEGVTHLGGFYGCDALTGITIPDSVTDIESNTFYECASLSAIEVGAGNSAFCSIDGVLFNKDRTTLIAYPGAKPDVSYTIPNGVTSIDEYSFTFSYRSVLKELRIPVSVKRIGYLAFFWDLGGAFGYLDNVYYCGTQQQWRAIRFASNNDALTGAKIHYDSHALTKVDGTEPTCTQEGLAAYWRCELCGKRFSDAEGKNEITEPAVLAPLGHDWGEWTVTTPATVDAEGEETRTCARCGETETRAIDKLTPPAPTNPFEDVAEDAFYYEPVLWAVYHDPAITTGTDATHFRPDDSCTRAQAVTFLWRAMDCPEPTTAENPFSDVSETDWYYKPVLWAAENGVTSGVGGGRFDPNGVCNRSQIVTFLWRATKPHEAQSAGDTFSDVPASEWFAEPVAWAVEKGITYGIGGGKFGPFLDCTRGQIVTFLYRCMK